MARIPRIEVAETKSHPWNPYHWEIRGQIVHAPSLWPTRNPEPGARNPFQPRPAMRIHIAHSNDIPEPAPDGQRQTSQTSQTSEKKPNERKNLLFFCRLSL